MDEQRIRSVIESILFVSEKPVSLKEITGVLGEGFDTKGVKRILDEMISAYNTANGGLIIREVANAYQMCTNPENAEYLRRLIDIRPFRLSRAALETLAIIAYRQPITKSEVEEIRGVDSTGAIRVLMEKRLIKIMGKKDEPGRPFLYQTTKEFMEFFDLKSLSDLPTLKDLEQIAREINEESGVVSQKVQDVTSTTDTPPKIDATKFVEKDNTEEIVTSEESREEVVVEEFDKALKRVETSNKLVRETLGISDTQNLSEDDPSKTAIDPDVQGEAQNTKVATDEKEKEQI